MRPVRSQPVGRSAPLGGIDLSLDGHSLFAGETTGGPIDQNGNPGASGLWTQTNSFYELDLTTGIATTHRGGVTFGQLADTLLTDGNSAPTTRHVAGTSRTDTFHFDTLLKNLTVTGFDPAHDVIDLHGQGFGTFDPLDAAHAKQIQGLDGTIDTLLTNRCRSRHPARERRPRVALERRFHAIGVSDADMSNAVAVAAIMEQP